MPVINGLSALQTRAVDAVLAQAFFPRAKRWVYPKICGTIRSTSIVEPFAVSGTVPALTEFKGALRSKLMPTWAFNSPNLRYKSLVEVSKPDYLFDQTGTVIKHAQACGVRLAELPEQVFAQRLIKASNTADASVQFKGTTYNITFDSKPLFSTTHNTGDGRDQSNLIAGNLPDTIPGLQANDIATNANLMIRDFQTFMAAIASVTDNEGQPIYPSIDTRESVIVLVPTCLQAIAELAFRSPNMAVINQTTNVMPTFVNEVITSSYINGMIDPATGLRITQPNETDWYIFIKDDFVKPMYQQTYRPPNLSEIYGYNVDGEIDRIMSGNNTISADTANIYLTSGIDTTFQKVGAGSDLATIQNDAFYMSPYYTGNVVYGFWPTAWRIRPSGGKVQTTDVTDNSSSSSSSPSSNSSSSSSSSSSSG